MLTVNSINHLSAQKQTFGNSQKPVLSKSELKSGVKSELPQGAGLLRRIKMGGVAVSAAMASLFGLSRCEIIAPADMDMMVKDIAAQKAAKELAKDSLSNKTITLAADTFSLAADSLKHIK